jgi:restriction endonuclease S subunit
MVSRATLEKLQIAVPDLETQQRILQIDVLAEHERELAQQLTLKHYELIHRVLVERAQAHITASGMERMPQ